MAPSADAVRLALALCAAFVSFAPSALAGEGAPAVPVNKLGPTGFVRDWVVVGGFPNLDVLPNPSSQGELTITPAAPAAPGARGFRGTRPQLPERISSTGYGNDYLAPVGGEAAGTFAPDREVPYADADGKPASAKPFNLSATATGYVDLAAGLNNAEHTVAYATCKVQADQAVRVTCYFGSDDSAKVWLNGKLVHSVFVSSRGAVRWNETFPLDLKAGQNDLLVKVEQRTGGWGFYLEVYRDEDMTAAHIGRVESVSFEAPSLVLPAGSTAIAGTFRCAPVEEPVALPAVVKFNDLAGRTLGTSNVTTGGAVSLPLPAGYEGYVEMAYSVAREGKPAMTGENRFYVGDYAADKAALLEKARAAEAYLTHSVEPNAQQQRDARRQLALLNEAERWLAWDPQPLAGRHLEVFATMKPAVEAMANGTDYQATHAGNLPALLDLPEAMSMPSLTYWVSLPPDYAKGGPWPVIIHLHGSGSRHAWDPQPAELNEGPLMNYKTGVPMPYICITPATNGGWDTAVLDKMLDEVLASYNADPDRVSLTGFSMGAMATYTWACARPDRFSALAIMSGNPGRNDLSKIAGLPIWIIHGENDPTVSPQGARDAGAALEKLGAKVRTTFHPGQGHLIQPMTQHTTEFWAWLASFKRQKPAENSFSFLGIPDDQSGNEGPAGIMKVTAVSEVLYQAYLDAKRKGQVSAEETHAGYVYYAVKRQRDVRFDNASAWVEITERYKAKAP